MKSEKLKKAQSELQKVLDEMTRVEFLQDEYKEDYICRRCMLPNDHLKAALGGGGLCNSCLNTL